MDTHNTQPVDEASGFLSPHFVIFSLVSLTLLLLSFNSPAREGLRPAQVYIETRIVDIPFIGAGTVFNGSTEVALGRSETRLRGHGFGLDLYWWSDEELWETIDSLESLAEGSYTSVGSVAPSIEDSLDSLYEEDDLRDDESWGPPSHNGLYLKLYNARLDEDALTQEPNGGRNVANTYFAPNPNGGSTGVMLGALGEDVRIKSRLRDQLFHFGYLQQRGGFNGGYVRSGPRLIFQRLKQEHDILVTSPSFANPADFSSVVDYDVTEDRFGLGYSILRNYRMNDKLSVSFGGGLNILYRDAELKARQFNQCQACGGTSEDSVTFNEKREDSGAAFDLDLSAGGYYYLSPRARLGLSLAYDYSSRIAQVETKDNPTDSLDLGTDNYDSWRLGLGYQYSF